VEREYSGRDGRFDDARISYDEGYMAEVLVGGQFAYAAVSSPDLSSIETAFSRALLLARSASGRELYHFGRDVRPSHQASWESPRRRRSELSDAEFSDLAASLSAAMRISDKIVQSTADLSLRDIETDLASTTGALLSETLHLAQYNLAAIARDGNVVQKRTANGSGAHIAQGGMELFDAGGLDLEAERAATEALELLSAEDCPSMTGNLVLAPDQMILQLHESVGHPCELDRILGDERNFAGSTFVRPEDIGSLRYGSDLMNVTFDPSVPGEAASYAFDDTGAPARREYLIRDGVLVRALGGLESQARAGKPGVACARSDGWARPPIDRMANLNLEPGASSYESIVSGIERGVYMESNRSWSIDDFRNKFQFGCEYAKLIEDGRITRTLRNPNYRGVSSDFWRKLSAVGDETTFRAYGAPNCGKGEPNQVVFVGHASPLCAFRDVEIFGGEP
jgi:predicted Zn-dependent protease